MLSDSGEDAKEWPGKTPKKSWRGGVGGGGREKKKKGIESM